MHDPTSIFRFAEHDIFIPMVVLEELDRAKKGTVGSRAQLAPGQPLPRRADESASKQDIDSGLPLPCTAKFRNDVVDSADCGHLFFQTQLQPKQLPQTLPGNTPDNNILGTALALAEMAPSAMSPWYRRTSTCGSRRR